MDKQIEEIIHHYPIITFNEIKRRVKNENYARLLIYRLIKRGELKRVSKGKYSNSENILTIASNLYFPSYISFLFASQYYGLTEIIPNKIQIITNKKHKPIQFNNYEIEFVYSKIVFGYHKQGKGKEIIFISDLEKLVIDAFLYPKYMGNFQEIINIFENISNLNEQKLLYYLKKTNSEKIFKQVGYMLEKYEHMDISEKIVIDRHYYDLNPFKKGKIINEKWRLKV